MDKAKAKKPQSVLFLWAVSYALPFVVLLLISVAVFIFSYRMIERKENDIKAYEFSVFQQQMDAYIDSMTTYSNEIQRNNTITESLLALNQGVSDKSFHYYKINRELNRYTLHSGNMPVYLFFEDDDFLLSGYNGGGSEFVYNVNIGYHDIPYSEFYDTVRNCNATSLYFLGEQEGDYSDYMLYVAPLSYLQYRYGIYIKMVCMIKNESVFQSIAYPYLYGNSLYIANGKEVARLSPMEPNAIAYDELLKFINSAETGKLQGHVISQQRSALYPFKYIMAAPAATYRRDITLVRNLIVVGVAAILFWGFVLTVFAIRMNYKPVKELMQLIMTDSEGYRGNEYSRIRSVFIQTMEDNRAKALALNNHAATLRNLYFERVLKGKEYDESSILSRFKDYGVVFPYPLFAVFILHPEESGAHALNADNQALIKETGLLLQETDIAYIFEMDDMIAGIVNFANGSPWASASSDWLSPLLNNIQDNLQIDLVYGQSTVCNSVARLGNAYSEAVQVVEYNFIAGGNVRQYSDLGDNAAPAHYYPIEREYYLINCMKTARYDAFSEMLNEIVDVNLSNQSLSINALLRFRMDLINTTIKMCEEVNRIYQQELRSEEIAEELMKCKSLRLVEQRILDYAQELCAFVSQEAKKPASSSLKDRIIAYVQEHYSDCALSNASIAEHLNNNPNYISSVFKTQHGSGINDFINATRIEAAKRLLRETQQTVDSIAAQVGYGNARTFIRVFKKLEAMTPTQYRELS